MTLPGQLVSDKDPHVRLLVGRDVKPLHQRLAARAVAGIDQCPLPQDPPSGCGVDCPPEGRAQPRSGLTRVPPRLLGEGEDFPFRDLGR